MNRIRIGDTLATTTQVGFGCAHLVGAVPWRQSRRLLDAAYDCGIRHFDVAPMYGFAEAEDCLGEFLRTHRAGVTITTKFGIPPGKRRRLYRAARRIGAPLLRPFIQRSSAVPVQHAAGKMSTCFAIEQARKSLESSLKRLKVDHIHVFLLHEARADDLQDDQLLRFLESSVTSGKIGTFGVGSDFRSISQLVRTRRAYCRLAQFQWSLVDAPSLDAGIFNILHGVFGQTSDYVFQILNQNKLSLPAWSDDVGVDLSNSSNVFRLLIRASILFNPNSIVLMASKRNERISQNCTAATDGTLDHAVRRFFYLMGLTHFSQVSSI